MYGAPAVGVTRHGGWVPFPARLLVLLVTLLACLAPPVRAQAETDPVGVWPLEPRPEVVKDFDPPDTPYGSGHRGVDLAGSPAQVVRTALPGRVSFAGRLAGRGVVTVSHGDTRTTYEPVSATVDVGDVVSAGQPIGTLELAGSHCFPSACLHWGWLRGEVYLDPLRLVGGGPVRLLPLWRDLPMGSPAPPLSSSLRTTVGEAWSRATARARPSPISIGLGLL